MARYHIITYGCTLNSADSDIIRGMLNRAGHVEVASEPTADILIVNSCQVKSSTETKILHRLRQLSKSGKPILLAGCLSINEQAVRKNAPHATIVGTSSIKFILDAVEDAMKFGKGVFRIPSSKENLPKSRPIGPIARIPISDGCLSSCTFCITRLARPKLSSYSIKGIVREVEMSLSAGAKEIQLTSQDAGAYGIDINTNVVELLGEVCAIRGDFRIRLGMINPQHITRLGISNFLNCYKSRKMYKFLHLPVQSGSDRILRLMRRGHNVAHFERVAKEFRKRFPSGMLATDIIVGFPGETEDDFGKTLALLRKWEFDITNISKFTPRPGTIAKKMPQLPSQVVKRRSVAASKAARECMLKRNRNCIGKTYSVLITERQATLTGRNNDYRQIALAKSCTHKLGERIKAKITGAIYSCCLAKPIKSNKN